jgi:hypothetical protein
MSCIDWEFRRGDSFGIEEGKMNSKNVLEDDFGGFRQILQLLSTF